MPSMQDIDAGRRLSDAITLHLSAATAQGDMFAAVGRWVAAKLEDGSTDGILYETKDEAVRGQSLPKICCYVKIPPDGMPAHDALRYIQINRNPMIDTTSPEHIINPFIFKRHSNLTPAQRKEAQRLEDKARYNATYN